MDFYTISRKAAFNLALSMYLGEPCRICGEDIENTDRGLIFAGYSKPVNGRGARAAHGDCWDGRGSKENWAYPEDD